MKKLSICPGSALRGLSTLLIAISLAAGCAKKESTAPPPATGTAASKSAEPNSFDEVTSRLDPGGSIYGYVSTADWLNGLSGRIGDLRETVLGLPGVSSTDHDNISQVFDIVTHVVQNSGVEDVDGVGVSGIALEKGFYQTKVYLHKGASAKPGYLWSVFGENPHPLSELDWLPADTALAVFGDVDLSKIWEIVGKEADAASVAQVKAAMAQMDAHVKQVTGSSLTDLLGSLGGEQGIAITLSDSSKVQLPIGNPPLEIPEPALLIAVKVKDDRLFDLIDKQFQKAPPQMQPIKTDENGIRARTMQIPLPLPIVVSPTVARYGDYLIFSSTLELVKKIADVKDGKKPGIKTAPEFQRLSKNMPTDGNSFSFVSERFGEAARDIQERTMSMQANSGRGNPAANALMQKLFTGQAPISAFSVGSNTRDGWFIISHGTREPSKAIALSAIVAPAAVAAALALPALAQAKSRAQSISCMNNLKQIGVAMRIWAMDHGDTFPNDFASMKQELGTPRVLFCPTDKNAPATDSVTWDNLDPATVSYQFVTTGLKTSSPDIASQVLVKCSIDGNKLMGDGSVVRGNNRTR